MAYRPAPYLVVILVFLSIVSCLVSNTHAAGRDPESFFYTAKDSVPVLDHGHDGYDFTKSKKPKVVEFYDPKCGACQAFKSNYIEVAKKVVAEKPNVEFYGVSCEAYPSVCSKYGRKTVPKIFVFPGSSSEPAGGIEVPKGTGTVYFLSARLMKALRTPEEIALDAEKLKDLETPRRHLGLDSENDDEKENSEDGDEEFVSGDEDIAEDEDEDEAEAEAEEEEVLEDGDEALSEVDNDESFGSKDLLSKDLSKAEEVPDDEEDRSKGNDERPSEESANKSKESQDGLEAPSSKNVSHGHYEDAALLEKYMKEDKSKRGNLQVSHDRDKRPANKYQKQADGSDRQDASEEKVHQPANPSQLEKYQHTDAYKNTMREFDAKDREHGKPKGYHYNKMKEERAAIFNKKKKESGVSVNDGRQIVTQKLPGSRQPVRDTTRQVGGKPTDSVGDTSVAGARDIPRQKVPSSHTSIMREGKTGEDKDGKGRGPDARGRPVSKVPSSHQSIRGNARQREVNSEDKQGRDASIPDQPQTPARQNLNSRQSIRENILQEERKSKENDNDAKSVLGRDSFPVGQPHSDPKPIGNINRPEDQGFARQHPPLPPHDTMSLGGDHYQNPFSNDPVKAKKFEDYIARRKKALERKEKLKHPIASIVGNGATEEEGKDMGVVHMKKSPMHNYKSQYNAQKDTTRQPDLRPEAQHKTFGQKVLKKIPIVKRAFKRSKGEETLNDAALSFTRGLVMGVFKTNSSLDYKRKAALVDWLDLLRVSLPPEIGLHELIDTLKYSIDTISERQENLLEVINKHPMPENMWSKDCTKGMRSGGFFCGFWKLLHVMSVGFAEQAGGLALQQSSPSIRIFSPKEAGDVIREYMAFFFNCQKCSTRFIGKYDDCSFDRCRRLSSSAVRASAEDWQEFPLWLWQVHNDISISKYDRAADFHKKGGRKAEAKNWELSLRAVYPHIDQCITCVTAAGTWKFNQVYKHLEKEYWTFGNEVILDPKMEKFLKHTDIEPGNASHGLGVYVLVALIMIFTLFAKKHRITATGRHKKDDTSSFDRFSQKYRVS